MTENVHYSTPEQDRIPLNQKVAFGIGMLANQLFPAALSIFMVVLVQGLGMSPILWGLIFFLPKLLDAIVDPLMGYLTDNTKSRWGRRRPYIFIGAIIAGLSYMMMWQLSADNGQMYNFYYFLGWSMVFFLGLTIFAVPYVAMGYEMSNDFHERTRLMATAQWLGQWAWVIAPWFWIILYDPDWFESAAEGARTLSIWVGLACMLLAMVPAVFCRHTSSAPTDTEDEAEQQTLKQRMQELFGGIAVTLKCKPFQKVCLATFLIYNAFMAVAGFSWFIIVYYMHGGDTGLAGKWPTLFGSVSALCTCFLVIPIVSKMAQTLGKTLAFLISQSISIFGYVLFWWFFSPENPMLMFIAIPLYAFGIGGLFTIMMSMTADICDLDELQTGQRREGTFGAIYWLMVKFGLAFAGLLSGFILSAIGFDQTVVQQTDETLSMLRLAYIAIPITGTVLAIFVMRNYDLDEQRATEIREQLEARRSAVAAS